jgi:hypothetical protein
MASCARPGRPSHEKCSRAVEYLRAQFLFTIMRYFQTLNTAVTLRQQYAPGPLYFTNLDVDYWAKVQPALLLSTIIVGMCAITSCIWAFFLHREFRWAIYRHISGSLEMLRRYLAYQVRLPLRLCPFPDFNLSTGSLGSTPNRAVLFNRICHNIWTS